ncbi:MAG: MFS transporter [Trueperella sp.]|nr:MFS transporter [Trueperella sp.]
MAEKISIPRIGVRNWSVLITIGLVGQIAWTIENMYLNLFVYQEITDNPHVIAIMVAASAVVATLTTLFMGALSDHIGKRKIFITSGYILWGITTLLFAFSDPKSLAEIFPVAQSAQLASIAVITLDCIMTFFGSTANDASFNAWVADVSLPQQRGRIQAVLSAFPLVAMLLVFGLLDPFTQQGHWNYFFFIVGGITIATGISNIFLMQDSQIEAGVSGLFHKISYGFRPAVVRQNPQLYLVFAILLVMSSAIQVYMPYLLIYVQNYLRFDNYPILLGIVLLGAALLSVVFGRVIDRVGKTKVLLLGLILQFVGLIAMYFARSFAAVCLSGVIMIGFSMVTLACLQGLMQDHFPTGTAGRFQGIRMIFAVMLPMIIGPFLGSTVIANSAQTYEDLGVVKQVPTPGIFLAAAIVLVLCALPYYLFIKRTPADAEVAAQNNA